MILLLLQMEVTNIDQEFKQNLTDKLGKNSLIFSLQWGSKNRTYPVFEWLKVDQTSNGPVFEWFWTKWQPKCWVFKCHYFTKISSFQMIPVFK